MLEIFLLLALLAVMLIGIWGFAKDSDYPTLEDQDYLDPLDLDIVEHENYWREDRY